MRPLLPALVLLGCTGPQGEVRRPPVDSGEATPDTDPGADTGGGPCPAGMVEVGGAWCADRYEAALQEWDGVGWSDASPYQTVGGRRVRAVSRPGVVPQGYVSGDEAEAACREAGKRLCTSEEWLATCQGPQGWTWPYGDAHLPGTCNDSYPGGHPVVDFFGTSEGVWDPEHMNDPGINQQPDTVDAAGANPGCVSAWGALDLHGNLHEWVADADGTFRGGFYADASINGDGCQYRTVAHGRGYHDYSTGFRCCVDL